MLYIFAFSLRAWWNISRYRCLLCLQQNLQQENNDFTVSLELSIWITIQQTWNFISYIMMYYEVSTHAILEGWKLLGIHMCLEGFLSLLWTRKQKYLHLQEISCFPLYSFYSIKLSCQNSNYLLMVLQHTQTFLFGLNNRGVGQITSNVVTFQLMWQWWSF